MSGTKLALASQQDERHRQSEPKKVTTNGFLEDVWQGLAQPQKALSSKYFYDTAGDHLFQRIMHCDDYYLTRCEMEVFREKARDLIAALSVHDTAFDLVELGAGDGIKTRHLLRYLADEQSDFRYLPVDISGHILDVLCTGLQQNLAEVDVLPFQGDYFDALGEITRVSERRKVILFLGSNIGNMTVEDCHTFCQRLHDHMQPGDLLITGFDLKKNPRTILKAYDDSEGLTRAFNLNLLRRINDELNADFVLDNFEHYQTYNPVSGACQSYLISQKDHTVTVAGRRISFTEHEPIFMEVSRKFSPSDIDELAEASGFLSLHHCTDSKGWFANAVWMKP